MTKNPQTLRQGLGLVAFVGTVALLGLSLSSAEAQQRPKGRPAKASSKPSASALAAAPSSSTPAAATASAAPPAVPATGPVPAPRAEEGDGGVRPSPLNPNADEMPGAGAPPSTLDYDKLLGDIAALRARVADVSDALFVSRIVLALQTDGDHARVNHLTVELDDGVVYAAPPNFSAGDPAVVYEHAVAPGHHAVTVEVDRKDDRDDTFRDSQRTRFIVDVPKDQRLAVTLRVGDDSNMAKNFPGDHRGKYDLRVRMQAAATPVRR